VMLPLELNSYPLDYRTAFACSLLRYPPFRPLTLRLAFPLVALRENDGLTTFRRGHCVG
jgi:hypothetical protein